MHARCLGGLFLLFCLSGSLRAAPSILDPVTDPVVGKWVWKLPNLVRVVTLEADGKVSAFEGDKGTWRTQPGTPGDQHKYRITWTDGLYVDLVTLVSPDRLEGRTNKNDAIVGTRAPALTPKPPAPGAKPDPILGKWLWQRKPEYVVVVTVNADGTATGTGGFRGVWEYQPEKFADDRRYVFVWKDGLYLDTVKLTAPDKLEGKAKQGDQVLNDRILARRAPAD